MKVSKNLYRSLYTNIVHFVGLYSGHRRICPARYGMHVTCIPRILLPLLMPYHYEAPHTRDWGCSKLFPPIPRSFLNWRVSCSKHILTFPATCCQTLSRTYTTIWSSQWSSITECKHIKAIKEPWHRLNQFNALGQMLLTNQRLDKLAALQIDLEQRGILQGLCLHLTSTWNTIGNCSYSMVHLPVQNADRNCYRACLFVVSVLRRSPWIWATIHQQEAYHTRWQWLMWSQRQSSESGTARSACTYTT